MKRGNKVIVIKEGQREFRDLEERMLNMEMKNKVRRQVLKVITTLVRLLKAQHELFQRLHDKAQYKKTHLDKSAAVLEKSVTEMWRVARKETWRT